MKYTYTQFKAQYPDDDACLDAIMQRRMGDEPVCPGCGVIGTKFHRITGRRGYACQYCGYHLFPCAGTIFEHSSTPLTLWFHAMYLLTATRNGVSAKELQRQLGVTYKCAWRIGHQLRDLMAKRDKATTPSKLSGHVEVDETYVGGYRKKKTKNDSYRRNKAIVMGMVERGGAFKGAVVENNRKTSLLPMIVKNVELGALVTTDTLSSYRRLDKFGYQHATVNHEVGEYVNGIHHTNRIEGFWSHLKRGISSTHVSVSKKHLPRYVNEFAFRYNNRQAPADMFNRMLAVVSNSKPLN